MTDIEFQGWGKIARLNRPITITEKIDGTNAAVGIVLMEDVESVPGNSICATLSDTDGSYYFYAQSRTRIITPSIDNHGFAKWVWDNAFTLLSDLGPGLHFGEWWGSGINRGYDLQKGEKRFSLFNTARHGGKVFETPRLSAVPVLYEGMFSEAVILEAQALLRRAGSVAAPGFDRPEGIVIYHHALNTCLKVTLERDEAPKTQPVKQSKRERASDRVVAEKPSGPATASPDLYLAFRDGADSGA